MMKSLWIAAATSLALATAGCATDPYGGGYGGGYGGTQLSACMRNALIGAGVGAVAGAIIGSEDNRGENAAIGAAVGGAGAYGACRYLGIGNNEQRIYGAYNNALATGRPQSLALTGQGGTTSNVQVAAPAPAPGAPDCRILTASVNVPGQGPQPLPQERYCRTPQGTWVPG